MKIIEFHKDAVTFGASDKQQQERADEYNEKRQQAAEAWIKGNGWTGTVTIDPVSPPAIERRVLDGDMNRFHDELVEAGIPPVQVEGDANGRWFGVVYEGWDKDLERKVATVEANHGK